MNSVLVLLLISFCNAELITLDQLHQLEADLENGVIKGYAVEYRRAHCHFCIAMEPAFQEVISDLKYLKDYRIVQLSCDDAEDYCDDVNVTGVPEIRTFIPGFHYSSFSGPREVWQIKLQILERLMSPAPTNGLFDEHFLTKEQRKEMFARLQQQAQQQQLSQMRVSKAKSE